MNKIYGPVMEILSFRRICLRRNPMWCVVLRRKWKGDDLLRPRQLREGPQESALRDKRKLLIIFKGVDVICLPFSSRFSSASPSIPRRISVV